MLSHTLTTCHIYGLIEMFFGFDYISQANKYNVIHMQFVLCLEILHFKWTFDANV